MRAAPALLAVPLLLAAGGDTPMAVLKAAPALPATATRELRCDAHTGPAPGIEQRMQQEMMAAQSQASGAPPSMTPAQMQAMQALTAPGFAACHDALLQKPGEARFGDAESKLQARLAEVTAAKEQADAEYCKRFEGCIGSPESPKQFNPKAAAAGTQFLKDARPAWEAYQREVAACVTTRESAIEGARKAGVGGVLAPVVASGRASDWGLVLGLLQAHEKLCRTAQDAAWTFLERPPGN